MSTSTKKPEVDEFAALTGDEPAAAGSIFNDNVEYFPFPKASDFESVRVETKAFNLTARMPIKSEPPIQLVQLLDHGMVFQMSSKSCAKGHSLELKFLGVEGAAKGKVDFTATCKVDKIKETPDGDDEVHVTLVQFEESDWEKLSGVFGSRQAEILEFLKAAKGL